MGEIRAGSIPASQPNFPQADAISSDTSLPKDGIGQQKENVSQTSNHESAPSKAENAAQAKSENKYAGTFKQTELNKKLNAGKTTAQEFPPNANNDQLGKIGVNRQNLGDQITTQFPNGVRIQRLDTMTVYSSDVRRASGSPTFQKANSQIGLDVTPPPGGKLEVEKNGQIVVRDSKGSAVAFLDSDGNLSMKTKQGDYTQNPDGKIRFSPNGNINPESLRKPGAINPKDYENYGITTDGRTLRFPNGVEYIPGSGVNVPGEIGKRIQDSVGPVGPRESLTVEEFGHGLDGSKLYDGHNIIEKAPLSDSESSAIHKRTYEIYTHNGQFHISTDGKISFEPSPKAN